MKPHNLAIKFPEWKMLLLKGKQDFKLKQLKKKVEINYTLKKHIMSNYIEIEVRIRGILFLEEFILALRKNYVKKNAYESSNC